MSTKPDTDDTATNDVNRTVTSGWTIVGFTATAQFFSVGIGYYTFGVYLVPLTESLGENRFWVSLALSMQTVLMAALSPLAGRIVSDYSIRSAMVFGVCMLSAGLIICSQANSLWLLYLGFGVVISVGVVFLGNIPCNLMLANWFVRRRGMALGISQAGITVSGVLLVPLATYLVVNFGWRTSFLVFAVLTPAILLPLIWKFAIRAPQDIGLHPDGDSQQNIDMHVGQGTHWNFARAIRERDIWLISLIAGPCYMGVAAVVIALPSHGLDLGLSPMQASTAVLVTTLFGTLAKPLAGTVSDYMSKRLVVGIAIVLQLLATGVLLIASDLFMLCLAGALFGLGYGSIAPLWSLLLAERFGLADFAKVMGLAMPLTMPFSLIGLPLTTLIFEMTGSYTPAFAFLFLGYGVSGVCVWLLRLPSDSS
ncbi:MAG TPA: MFS transporter [Gammaproteobacteria bacterium]|nr:MFS transporter [Gammaproteobacteria bacterium]HIK69194.1 MFS transporter [Pseudomonadales bacterium]